MLKKISNLGKTLNRVEQKKVFGGFMMEDEGAVGECRDAYPQQPAGCACNKDNQCASNDCSGPLHSSGWWRTCK